MKGAKAPRRVQVTGVSQWGAYSTGVNTELDKVRAQLEAMAMGRKTPVTSSRSAAASSRGRKG